MPALPEDAADRHVARWRGHWVLENQPYDDTVEAVVTRMGSIMRHLRDHKKSAAVSVGLESHEYETLHALMIRDTPGTASPTTLADELGLSPAGMSGRLESMERSGYVRRTTDPGDRRRLGVEATAEGIDLWRRTMAARGSEEERILGSLTAREQATLSRLLKRIALDIEAGPTVADGQRTRSTRPSSQTGPSDS
ncbi:MarR family winged helix-turn-helix transcriptional regulator [Nocardioides jensenii]|uniref:MarR family winged helix-turn-helix transcriptional regulator n=1 Tax=Nocardioides jensenii TaxID=1843 RepID=UPI0009EA90CC|nr:MarR family transcriptional regulator [Nocardioides jensenii]